MRAFLDRMRTQLREYFEKTTRRDKIRLAVIAGLVIVLAVLAVILLSRTKFELLLDAQTPADAGEVLQALQDMGVQTRIEGTRVLVPSDKVDELRATLSAQQIIGPDDTNLDILNSASGFSITDAQQKKLFEAQRAYEIRSQILTSEKMQNCRVIVNFGETSPFLNPQGARDATASVIVTLRSGSSLTKQEAQTIAEIVRASVPGIRYENITIADNALNFFPVSEPGNVLEEDSEFGSETLIRIELEKQLQQQLQSQGEQLIIPIFGPDNVKVTASVTLNFDKVTIESVEFDPPVPGETDGIVRSSSEIWERWRGDAAAAGIPGTDSNGMGTVQYPYGDLEDGDLYGKSVDEKNYEINETRTLIERERGKIEALSIAVIVNSDAVSDDYTDDIADLVSRGLRIPIDNVAVKGIPFVKIDTSVDDEEAARLKDEEERMKQRELIATIIMYAVILLLGLALMLLIRSVVRLLHPPPPPLPLTPEPLLAAGGEAGMGINYIADDDEDYVDMLQEEEEIEEDEIELNKKSTGLEQIEKFIDRDPGTVAQLLRNWLADEEV